MLRRFWYKLETLDSLSFSKAIYKFTMVFILLFGLATLGLRIWCISWAELIPPNRCSFLHNTGLYCAGCGGTRAILYLLEGEIFHSFIHHPVVLFIAIGLLYFILAHTWAIISKDEKKRPLIKAWYFYGLAAVILIQFFAKNYLVISEGRYIIDIV